MRNLFLRRFRVGRLITLVAVITVGGLLSAGASLGWRSEAGRPQLGRGRAGGGFTRGCRCRSADYPAIGGLYDLGGVFSTYSTAC